MQRKASSNVREAVEAKDVTKALSKVRNLSSDEEKVVRMRYGAKVDVGAPLPRHGEGDQELSDELLVLEMQLLRAYRQHQQLAAQKTVAQPSRTKEKIVRALRKKH
jgi:hypothetical protein